MLFYGLLILLSFIALIPIAVWFAKLGIGKYSTDLNLMLRSMNLPIDHIPYDATTWGVTGDFFGGTINPLISAISFILLFATFRETKRQITLSETFSYTQSFESNFYNMLNLHVSLVENIKIKTDVLDMLYTIGHDSSIFNNLKHKGDSYIGRDAFSILLKALCGHSNRTNLATTYKRYSVIQNKYNFIFGHYFRNLYQILRYIDKSTIEDKPHYSRIIRAQLSTSELAILLINCRDDMVDDGSFKKLIIKYKMLEHLPIHLCSNNFICLNGETFPALTQCEILKFIPNINDKNKVYGAFGNNRCFDDNLVSALKRNYE